MVRRRRRGVYAVIKKGRRYWEFKAKDPHTGEWFTQSVSKKLMRDLGIEATGRGGTINEKDAQTVKALFQRELEGLASTESVALRAPLPRACRREQQALTRQTLVECEECTSLAGYGPRGPSSMRFMRSSALARDLTAWSRCSQGTPSRGSKRRLCSSSSSTFQLRGA